MKGNNTGNKTKQLQAYSGSVEFPLDLPRQTSVQNLSARRHVCMLISDVQCCGLTMGRMRRLEFVSDANANCDVSPK